MKELLEKLYHAYRSGCYTDERYFVGFCFFVDGNNYFTYNERKSIIDYLCSLPEVDASNYIMPPTFSLIESGFTLKEAVQKRIDWLENHIKTL